MKRTGTLLLLAFVRALPAAYAQSGKWPERPVRVIGGQIQFMIASGPALVPHVKSGRLRAFAITTERRSPVMPDVPAIAEFVPGYSVSGWNGMWAPAGTPREIVSRLNQALARILRQPDIQEKLRADGREPAHSTPEEFASVLARDITT